MDWPTTSAGSFRYLVSSDFRVLPARFDAARQNVVLVCDPGRGVVEESNCGSDLAWREHGYRGCGAMPKAVRRNPVAEFCLGPVSYQLGDRFRCERAATCSDPERIMLVHARESRPHLVQVVFQESYHLMGQRHLVWAARLHLRAFEYEPPFFANLAKMLADLGRAKPKA
jgi:hypothetical protein